MKRITVLLADDHMLLREGLRKILEREADIEVVGEAQDGLQAIALALQLRPDLVLMDIAMPLLNGFEATRRLLKVLPNTKVLILSAHSPDAYVRNAADVGAMGFVIKQASIQDVCQAIRDLQSGMTFYSPSVSRQLERQRRQLRDRAGRLKWAAQVTPREMEVLRLIAKGKANKQTASELGVCIKTIEKHREHLMAKLDIHDTAGLTRYAVSVGAIGSSVPRAVA